jgi:peptidyl-prolyl cis-trans isomerase C
MLNNGKFALLAIIGSLAVTPAFAEDKSAAMVNGVSIPQSRVDFRVKAAVAQGQADSPELRKAVKEDMVNLELLVQESKNAGLDKNPEVQQQIDLAKLQVLVGAYVQDYLKNHPISDEQLKQDYDKRKSKLGDKEYNARHILVETEAEAKDIIAQLGKKAKFEKLAEKSKDTGSAAQGGSLGWAPPANYVAPFAEALATLKKGEYTKVPVQTQFGFHVIKLDDVRELKVPAFDDVKQQLQQGQQQQVVKKLIDDLRAKAKIE